VSLSTVTRTFPPTVGVDAAKRASDAAAETSAPANAMLLNEFLKEHRQVQELKSIVARQEATIAQQQKIFTERLKEQDAKIQAVNERLERSKAAPQMVADNQ
jgi:hypothetical protein